MASPITPETRCWRKGWRCRYAIPDSRSQSLLADIPIPTGPWRAVVNGPNAFANECFLDELAAALQPRPLRVSDGAAAREQPLAAAGRAGRRQGRVGRAAAGRARARHRLPHLPTRPRWRWSLRCRCGMARCGCTRSYAQSTAALVIHPGHGRAADGSGVSCGLLSLKAEITFEQGRAQQSNFKDYPLLRIGEMPEVEVAYRAEHARAAGRGRDGRAADRAGGGQRAIRRHRQAYLAHPNTGQGFIGNGERHKGLQVISLNFVSWCLGGYLEAIGPSSCA